MHTTNHPKQEYLILKYNLCKPIFSSEEMVDFDKSELHQLKNNPRNKTDNLRENVQKLCDILNNAGIKNESLKWQAGSDPKSTFGGGICFDKKAFNYLKSNGYLDNGVCWKCGKEPISKEFSFTNGADSTINYNICSDCFKVGKKIQNIREGKGSLNCYIATVCYGNIYAPEVEILRQYRDNQLSSTIIGTRIINLYYTFSPQIAHFLKDKKHLNRIIKTVILNPTVKLICQKGNFIKKTVK